MKKLITLLTLLVVAVTGAWADTTYYMVDRTGTTPTLTSDFRVEQDLVLDGSNNPIEFEGNSLLGYVRNSGTQSAITGTTDFKKHFAYEVKSTATKIKLYVYNTNSSGKELYISEVKEGETSELHRTTKAVASKTATILEYETTNTKNSTIFFYVNGTNIQYYQIEAVESGTPLPTAGEPGYELNFNKGRACAKSGTSAKVDGIELLLYSDYKPCSSTEARIKNKGTQYIKFTTTVATEVSVNVSTDKTYYISSTIDASEAGASSYTANATKTIPAGTWYIVPNGSEVKVTKLSFAASGLSIKTQPVSAEYILNATATPLTVVAQGGTEPYTYQWYSCSDAEKTNPQAVGTNSAYTPSTAATGYYYCKVTDSATPTPASVESNVATITISAAAAPTFTSVTPSETNVVKGTASTITAVVEGNPDPTVTWYSCDDAEKTDPIEAGTGLVLNLTNDVTGTFYYYAVATNSIGSATSDVQTISVKEKLATPTVSGDRYFLESVTATINVVDGTTVKYKKNGGAEETYVAETVISSNENMELQVWAEKDGFLPSDKVTVNFKKVTDTGVTAVDEVSSWDWSKPKKTSADAVEPSPVQLETLLSSIASDFDFSDFEPALTSIKYINAQRFTVKDDYVQAHGFVIKTSVSGKLDFKVRGTNSNTRYVVVNGENAGTVNSPSSDKNINSIAIPVGTTVVYGLDEASQAANNIRYYNVTFTPAANITDAEWATTVTPDYAVDFADGVQAYIVESVGEAITLKEIDDAPANTPIIVNASKGSYTMTKKAEATADVTGNLLMSSDGSIVGTTTGSPYVLGKNSSKVVGFGPLANGVTLAAGKAYIPASAFSDAKDFYPFVIGDEESETTSINSIENGESRIENYDYIYNLAGQKVSKDYKGIVIVNGKKVIRK